MQPADIGQVAVPLGEIEAVADDELVGDVEADLEQVQFDANRVGFTEQRDNLERLRLPGAE